MVRPANQVGDTSLPTCQAFLWTGLGLTLDHSVLSGWNHSSLQDAAFPNGACEMVLCPPIFLEHPRKSQTGKQCQNPQHTQRTSFQSYTLLWFVKLLWMFLGLDRTSLTWIGFHHPSWIGVSSFPDWPCCFHLLAMPLRPPAANSHASEPLFETSRCTHWPPANLSLNPNKGRI